MRVLELINQQLITNEDKIAMYIDEMHISYNDLMIESEKIATALIQYPKNIMIGITMKNPIQFIKWYIAALKCELIPCVLDPYISEEKTNEMLTLYHIPLLVDDSSKVTYRKIESNTSLPRDILHIGFTSGTTGIPKAYMRNHQSWIQSFKYNEGLLKGYTDIIIAPGPHAHSLTLYAMIYTLCTGRTFIGQKKFNTQVLNKLINKFSENQTMFIVPTMLYSLLNHNVHLMSVTSIFSSGAKLSNLIFEKFKHKYSYIDFIEFFGSSEASFISYNINGQADSESVGKLFPSVQVQIKDKDENDIGKLYVKSDMTFSGYLNEEVHDEWIKIGDWASISADQELRLFGRESDRLIIGGKNVYPEIIEQKLLNLDIIDEAIIISKQHNKFGEIAILLYKGKDHLQYLSMKKYLLACGLSRYEIPSQMIRVKKMKYTFSGKIARYKMKSIYELGGEAWNQLL
ncbi:AMP-binding protein [Mammaliicoccus sciuri]|uniref:AMP-binding protein n=1 Tax=Mammaliicoccus sciuri TaxID=1296 RepID=UPI001E61F582|nr:AMP-binding protein [Mammaliicoccus sciuri]MCD8800895.1 AMP-binding protein [Mammaliicoccus sciuri]